MAFRVVLHSAAIFHIGAGPRNALFRRAAKRLTLPPYAA
jgi:hypothetical protein